MAATVDDLIATISSGVHVGQEGYDLRALQVRGSCFLIRISIMSY